MTHRFLIAAALFLSITVTTKAQFSVGVSAGANVTFWDWYLEALELDLYDPGPGFRFDLNGEYQFTPGLALRGEMAYQRFSNRFDAEITDVNGGPSGQTFRHATIYNSIGGSLLLKFFPLKKVPGMYLVTGPTFANITGGWWRVPGGAVEGRDKPWRQHFDIKGSHIRADQWLADIGLGYAQAIGAKNRVAVECRFQHGLTSIANSIDSRIQTVLLTVGYQRNL